MDTSTQTRGSDRTLTFNLAYGSWKRDAKGIPEFSDSKPPSSKADLVNASASITTDQLRFEYSYKNLASTSTDYTMLIRRSTLRFSERLEAPDSKAKGDVTIEHSGYCASFHNQD